MARRRRVPTGPGKMHVRKGDKVVVIKGADRGDEPREVLEIHPETGRVVVAEVNVRIKHARRSQENPQGGRIEQECPIDASNVLLWSEKAGKGVRTRTELIDGKRVRVGVSCGTKFD